MRYKVTIRRNKVCLCALNSQLLENKFVIVRSHWEIYCSHILWKLVKSQTVTYEDAFEDVITLSEKVVK